MSTEKAAPPPTEREWTTGRVAEFLGISRQAVHKRLRKRRLIGLRVGAGIRFPDWQFAQNTSDVRPEALALLERLGDGFDIDEIARWTVTPLAETSETPADMLVSDRTRDEVLRLADECRLNRSLTTTPHEAEALSTAPAPPSRQMLERVREQVASSGSSDPRTAILLAATELFALRGPAKVSLRSVASAAGVPYSLIYRYYGTKENLLGAAMEMLVKYGGLYISEEPDAYAAIRRFFAGDDGWWGRMVNWAMLDEVPPDLFGGREVRSGGYREHIEQLWAAPFPPAVRTSFDPQVLASLIQLVSGTWDGMQPYLSALAGGGQLDAEEQREQVVEMLQLLAWATRPDRAEPGRD